MYSLLVGLMLIVAVTELGLNLAEVSDCRSRACLVRIERRARDALKINWKPISVFPNEARRFR